MGLGRQRQRRLLVAECKGWGRPEDYQHWLTPGYLWELDAGVRRLAGNIGKIADPRWKREFARRRNRPDEVWYVFPGTFDARSDPSSWKIPKYVSEECAPFVRVMSGEVSSCRQAEIPRARAEAPAPRGRAASRRHRWSGSCRSTAATPSSTASPGLLSSAAVPDTAAELLRWTARTVARAPSAVQKQRR